MPRAARQAPAAPVRALRPRARSRVKLSPASGEPLYKQVVQSLRGDIVKGAYPVGTQLPTEDELAARFAVSRHTVRAALSQLRADGLVSSRQGSGTRVMPPPTATPFNVHRVASIDELVAYAAESRYDVEQREVMSTEQAGREDLGLPAKGRWLRLQGFRRQDDPAAPPVCWTEVFIAAEYAGVERMLARPRGPIWRLIEDMYGERLSEVEQILLVREVPAEIARGLQVEPGSPVVEVRRVYRTSNDKVAELAVNLYPADKFRFSMNLRRA